MALDVYDILEARIEVLVGTGIARDQIIVDPGIGFGKALEHNLTLLQNLSLFHTLGCPILLGASRKRFIGTIGGSEEARHRAPGSIAVALAGGASLDSVDGAVKWSGGANGVEMNAIFLDPTPITKDNVSAVIDAGHIEKDKVCAGAMAGVDGCS